MKGVPLDSGFIRGVYTYSVAFLRRASILWLKSSSSFDSHIPFSYPFELIPHLAFSNSYLERYGRAARGSTRSIPHSATTSYSR